MFTMIWLTKRGQVKKQLESGSSAMLKLWIVQNVTSGYAVILDEDYNIIQVFESKNKSMAMPIDKEKFPFEINA